MWSETGGQPLGSFWHIGVMKRDSFFHTLRGMFQSICCPGTLHMLKSLLHIAKGESFVALGEMVIVSVLDFCGALKSVRFMVPHAGSGFIQCFCVQLDASKRPPNQT